MTATSASPSEPRVPPLALDDADEAQAALLEPLGGDRALHLFRTLAHHPALMKSWLRFGGQLLQRSSLPGRDRELVILRVAMRCGSDYEWGQHVAIARDAGVSDDEILRVAEADVDEHWSAHDAALLRAVDELLADHCLSDETWARIAERYDTAQAIELTLLAGHYAMLAGSLRSLGVQTETPLPRVGSVSVGSA